LYELIKLYSDVRMSLEIALSPRAASSSPYAYRKTWHLYQLLSRALQVREFEDVDTSGYSELSQSVIESYADELEQLGLWEWAAFVLLHLADASR
jgi:nuclear pore complex protein Nup98-Nup96